MIVSTKCITLAKDRLNNLTKAINEELRGLNKLIENIIYNLTTDDIDRLLVKETRFP